MSELSVERKHHVHTNAAVTGRGQTWRRRVAPRTVRKTITGRRKRQGKRGMCLMRYCARCTIASYTNGERSTNNKKTIIESSVRRAISTLQTHSQPLHPCLARAEIGRSVPQNTPPLAGWWDTSPAQVL